MPVFVTVIAVMRIARIRSGNLARDALVLAQQLLETLLVRLAARPGSRLSDP
ncbi:MAG: hypothetical protein ACREPL_04815 [Rhodanobacteraceae bacterium]